MSEERLLFEHAFYDRVFHKENGNAFARQLNMHIRPIQIAHPISTSRPCRHLSDTIISLHWAPECWTVDERFQFE